MEASLFSRHSSFLWSSPHVICHNRVFLALVERQEDRGTVVAQGGGKVELSEYIQSRLCSDTTHCFRCLHD